MVYDAHRKAIVMFGGRGADGKPMNDTWTWDGSAWKIMPSAGAPSPRHSATIAYDVCRAEAVMFGGVGDAINSFAPQPGETWTWDGARWTKKSPLLSPPPRIGASMAYSPASGRVLLYGGFSTTDTGNPTAAVDTDVWRWEGASATGWEKMNSDATTLSFDACNALLLACNIGANFNPPPRGYASFAHLSGDKFNLYGGTSSVDLGAVHSFFNFAPQGALGDHHIFAEQFWINTDAPAPFGGNTPLTRRCFNPVPIPSDGAPVGGETGPEAPKVEVREGMREIGRLPVLVGTDWSADNRNTFVGFGSSAKPNPNYTPAPDCPNRSTGENGASTYLATDSTRNRIYQFFICDPNRGYTPQYSAVPPVYKLLIGGYDGTSLKLIGSVVTPIRVATSGYQTFLGDMLLHDADRGRFLLRTTYYDGGNYVNELTIIQQDLIEKGTDPVVKKIPLSGSISKLSFFNHPKTGSPKLLINRGGTSLSQVDLENNAVDWNATATGCAGMGGDHYTNNMRPMRSGNYVYNACSGSVNGTNRMGVVRIPIIENADGSETPGTGESFGGPFSVSANWGDPKAERMLLLSVTAGGSALWVFDGKTARYIGYAGLSNVGFGDYAQFGLDDDAGRFYHHSADARGWVSGGGYSVKFQGGLRMVDTRLTPIPQPLNFPQFSAIPGTSVVTLPSGPGVPRRVFIRRAEGQMKKYPDGETVKMPNEMFYTVLADEVPVPRQTEIADLDALTIPVPETPGKTEVSFDAEGSGYGIRLRGVGGIVRVVPFGELLEMDSVRPAIPACAFPDREVMAGWVPQARLSDLDALARSSGLEVDSNSKTDLEGPFSRCTPAADASNLPPSAKPVFDVLWPLWGMVQLQGDNAVGPRLKWDEHFEEVECVGDALSTHQATVGNVYGSAKCVKRDGLVEATARGSAPGVGPAGEAASSNGFSVAEGYSSVTVTRDPKGKGVVVTSTAVARGIQIPGLSIDRVETKAEAWSNGRPSDIERASFTRTVCGVVTPDYSNSRCLTAAEQKQMADNWNARMGNNGKMYLPIPDPELFKGSPGGYIVGVIKPETDQFEDQLFAKDYQKEVPGLVIEFYKDSASQGPGRQALLLAAVRAVAGLGVQCSSDFIFSQSAKDCVPLTFGEELLSESEEEFEDEGEFLSDDAELDSSDGGWTLVDAAGAPGESIGSRIGRFIGSLPIIRQLPIRQMGEALLAGSVWMLLGIPLFLASRRFALNRGRTN